MDEQITSRKTEKKKGRKRERGGEGQMDLISFVPGTNSDISYT